MVVREFHEALGRSPDMAVAVAAIKVGRPDTLLMGQFGMHRLAVSAPSRCRSTSVCGPQYVQAVLQGLHTIHTINKGDAVQAILQGVSFIPR